MAWNTPKVDWTSTDYFNVEDWNRIRENTEYVNQYLAEAGYKTHSLLDTMLDRNNLTLPTVSLVNKLEENLQLVLTDLLSNPPNALNMVTWYGVTTTSYQRNPNSDDWNRWESVVSLLKEDLDYISSYTYYKSSGAYVSGQYSQLWRAKKASAPSVVVAQYVTLLEDTVYTELSDDATTMELAVAEVQTQVDAIVDDVVTATAIGISYVSNFGHDGEITFIVAVSYSGTTRYTSNIRTSIQTVPYNVELLDSIESDGSSYIDTGVYVATGISEINFTFDVSNVPQTYLGSLFGARGATADASLFSAYLNAGSGDIRVDFGNASGATPQPSDHIINIRTTSTAVFVNDDQFNRTTTEVRNSKTLYIFAEHHTYPAYIINRCKLVGENTIVENDIEIINLVPVKILATNEICMYDYVTHQYFKNVGTGAFTGHSKSTPEYADVEVVD